MRYGFIYMLIVGVFLWVLTYAIAIFLGTVHSIWLFIQGLIEETLYQLHKREKKRSPRS